MWLLFKEEFEDTKGVIRISILKKNRQHNGQKKKDKQRSIKHTHKSKDRVTRNPLKTGSSCSTSGTRRINLVIWAQTSSLSEMIWFSTCEQNVNPHK